jgi:hypothetical protein
MRTIHLMTDVGADRRVVVQLPPEVEPGPHQLIVVVDEAASNGRHVSEEVPWPTHDVGPWPEDLSTRREDLYDDTV